MGTTAGASVVTQVPRIGPIDVEQTRFLPGVPRHTRYSRVDAATVAMTCAGGTRARIGGLT
mgnify:CR=1 FL=1